jgi:hypothetical protein
MVYGMASPDRVKALSDGTFDPANVDDALADLVPLLAHMFRAPPITVQPE